MINTAVRARRSPMEGHQLGSYMKHVKTIAQHKGFGVAIEYDGQFRLQRLPKSLLGTTSNMTCMRSASPTVSFRGNILSRSPFMQADGLRMSPFFASPLKKTTIHVPIADIATPAPSIGDVVTVSQTVEYRVRNLSQPRQLTKLESVDTHQTSYVLHTPIKHKV